jgi:serine/threonine protein kinase
MPGLEGTTLGRYYLVRKLGQGGMSEVYLAYDQDLERQVAVKVVGGGQNDYIERFQREADAIYRLKHDHILPPLEYGVQESWYYLAMPYVEYGTLHDRLEKGPLMPEAAGEILTQIASALQFAHDNGILHRDIKPSNILLRNDHYAYLADFGLAKELERRPGITHTGILLGTPEYMAPDLSEGPATPSSDIYALGVVLYEMVTGLVPFTADTPVAVYWKHIREQPLPPSHFNPMLSPAIDQVILCALEKDPGCRFQTARALCDAYKQALQAPALVYQQFEEKLTYENGMQQEQEQPFIVDVPSAPPIGARRRPQRWNHIPGYPWRRALHRNPVVTPPSVPAGEQRLQYADVAPFPPSSEEATIYEPSEPVVTYPAQQRRLIRRPDNTKMIISVVAIGLLMFMVLPMSCAYYFYVAARSHNQSTVSSAAIEQPTSTGQHTQTASSVSIDATEGTPLISDRLDSNTNGHWTEDPTHCIFTDGTYHIAVTQTNFLQSCGLLALSIDNAAVQVDVSLLSGRDAGILLRANGEEFYDFEINNQGQFFFRRHDPGGATTYRVLIPETPSNVIAPASQKNTLLIIARGDDFKLYINGTLVGEVHDNTYTGGSIALAAGTLAPQTVGEGSFANFKLFKIA